MTSFHLIWRKIKQLLKDEAGPTAVEYAFILALIIAVAITGITILGDSTGDSFQDSNDRIEASFSS